MSEMPRLFPGQTTLFSPAGEQQEPELPRLSPSVKPPQVLEAEAAKNLHLTRGEKAASVAQDLAVANQLGVDPGLVGRNRDELYSRADTEAAIATLADAPALSEFMAQDRINTILAKDELGLLASLEREFKSGLDRMSVSYDVGNLYAEELIQLRYAQNMGDESPETQARVDAVKAKIKAIQPAEPNNLWERFMGVLGQQTPIQEEIIGSSVQGALEGALVGGTVGAVGGGPLAPVGASAGAAVGAGAGAVARTVETSFRLETGSAFDEFLDSGMDKETARWASRTYGALASAIETITVPVKAIPGVGQLSQAAMSAPKAALRNTIKGAVLRFLGGATKMQVGEAAEEALQTITQGVIKSAGQMFDGTVVTGSVEETLDNAFNAAIDSLLYPLGAGMQTPQLTADLYSVRAQRLFEEQAAARTRITGLLNGQLEAAQVDEDMLRLDTLRQAATQSTLRQADPARFEQLIAAQVETSKTNITEVFISGEAFAAAVQSVSPEEVGPLFQALGLTMDTVNEAVATGADVTVAMSKYMAHMAGTQLDTALVNDIRTRAKGMTVNEREAWLAESQDELAKLADEAKTARERNQILDTEAAQIEEAITNEIDMTTSVATKAVAPQLATIWSSFFTTLASRGFLDTSHEGSAWKAFRTVWPDVRSDTWQSFQRQKEAGLAIVDQQALQQDAAYAGVENEAEVEEAGRLWAEMGTESPYFKRWSGEAPVVLKNAAPSFTTGQAVVVEADHGAPDIRFVQEDGIFKSEKERYGFGRSEAAHWFTRDTATAKTYADPRRAFDYQNAEPGVVSAYVRLDNPFVVNAAGQNWRDAQKRGKTSDVIAEARANGHDGVIIYNVKDDYNNDKKTRPTTTLTVFSSTQIKSVNNRGTFDPADARILNQSLSPEAQAMAEKILGTFLDGTAPKAKVDTAIAERLMGMIRESETTGADIGVDALKRVKEGQTLFQQQSPLGFVSAVETAISGMDFKTMPGKDLANRVKKTAGIKAEELEDLGLVEWLEGAGNTKVTKEQVVEYVRQGGPKIEEVQKGTSYEADDREAAYNEALEQLSRADAYDDHAVEVMDAWLADPNQDNTLEAEQLFIDAGLEWDSLFGGTVADRWSQGSTKFSQYTMPGGENYREVLMTLPDASNRESARKDAIAAELEAMDLTPETMARREELRAEYRDLSDAILARGSYQSSHWDDPNVLVHFRLNDRTGPNGEKVLFIEEIQSDWHQEGRKKGYRGDQEKRFNDLIQKRDALSEGQERDTVQAEINRMGVSDPGVPNAPLKKSWNMLAMKRILRMAAEQGYDSVAWTPGEVQAERYDLSKQIEGVEYQKNSDETYDLVIKVDSNHDDMHHGGLTPPQIEELLGKEVAEKIVSGEYAQGEFSDGAEYGELENIDLKVGGEGMKGFYDKILPAEVNKYAKKWGVKAAPGTVSGQQVWTLPITDQMRQDILQGQPLYQQQDQANAAVDLTAGPSGTPIVTLFETANESSFLHESGHVFVRFIQQIAQQPGASQELKDLWSAIAKEIGHEGRGPIQVEAHEKFARALEVYFAEGKAPSKEMIPVFAAFATWLKRLYTTLFMKGHKPSPELAALFDRLFATDDQIAEREAAHEAARPFFVSAEAMLEAEREAYGKLRKRAEETARDKALRQMTKAYVTALGGKKQFTADAKAEADKLPVYRAADFIAANGGLNILDVDNRVGEETRNALGKKLRVGSLTKSGTLDPDRVAKDHGYQNAEAMLQALLDAEPKGQYVKRVSEEKMAEKREVLERGMADDAAEEHYHSDERLAVLIAETEMLRASQARAAGQTARKAKAIELAAVREVAREVIKQKTVSKASSYKSFLRAELAASKKARRAMEAGDKVEAEKWKRQEMLNHALVLEAIDARERVEKGKARLERQRKNGKADEDVRDMLTDIAIRFGLVTRPPKVSLADSVAAYNKWLNEKGADGKPRKVIDFGAWAAEQESKGYGTQISPLVSDRSQMADYRDLTLAEFEDILGSANHIATIESRERTIKVGDKWVEVEEVVNALIAQMQMTRDAKQRSQFNPKWYMKFLEADASLEKMELLFKSLDGGTLGPFYEYFMDRVNKAKEREDDMMLKAANDLTGMMAKHYTFSERQALFGKRILVKEIGESITKAQLLRVLLDFGNGGNYMRRRDGNGWTDEQMEALKAYADKRDWDYIQEVWNYLDTYRPEAFQVHKDLTGATPEQIMPREVQTPYGVYAGGYFPSVIDKKYNTTAQARQQIENAMLYGTPNFAHAMTKHGHTKARMQSAGGQALSIELSDLTDHVFGVIHDITHRAAVMDVAKIIRHKDFNREAIAYMGKEVYDQLTPWIKDIANSPLEPATFPEKAFRAVRMGTTVARLAKIGVGLQQIAGLTQSVAQLKGDAGKLLKVLGTYMINPKRMLTDIAFANESSAFMRHRITSTTREAADTFRGLTLQGKAMAEPGRMMMRFMGACQKFGTDVPTWRAAYDAELSRRSNENMAAIDAHKRAVEYADHIVRISQGSGDIKDLTQIQRSKSEMVKAITMFYSFLASAYAQMVHPLRGKKVHLAHFMLTTTMLAIIGPSLAEILSGRPPEDEDEDGEADWDIWVAKNSLQFGLSLVPGVKDVLGSAASGFGYNMTPIESPIRDLVWLLRNTPDVVANEEYEKLIKPGANVFGVLFKFPSDQVLITGTAAYKLLQDDPDYGYLDLIYKRRKE